MSEDIRFQKFLDEELKPVLPEEQFISVATWCHWGVISCPGIAFPIVEILDDSVMIVWKKKNTFLEIEVFKNGDMEWLISDQCSHQSGSKSYHQIGTDDFYHTLLKPLVKILEMT